MSPTIRPERPSDAAAVYDVVTEAFASARLGTLVGRLRAEPSYRADRALVAQDDDGRIVGFVMVTDSTVTTPEGPEGRSVSGGASQATTSAHRTAPDTATGRLATLSPLAVAPDRQRQGIGAALVHAVVARCAADGEPAVALEGSPGYYGRLGFTPAADHGLVLPLPAWASAASAQVAVLDAERIPRGTVTYAPPFDALDH